jgi:hypothetical protein
MRKRYFLVLLMLIIVTYFVLDNTSDGCRYRCYPFNNYDTLEKLPPTCEQEDLLISKMEESELKTFVIEKGMVSYTNFTDICDTEPIYSNSTGDQFTCFYFCGV